MRYLSIALSKGRLTDISVRSSMTARRQAGSRKLIFTDETNRIRFFLVKPADVPTYVEYGAADMGIVGKDTLLEEGRHLYEVLDMGFAACRMVVAGPAELAGKLDSLNNKRVATKYPRVAKEYFEHKRVHRSDKAQRFCGTGPGWAFRGDRDRKSGRTLRRTARRWTLLI